MIVIRQRFEEALDVFSNSKLESPLFISETALDHRQQMLNCCFFADDFMQIHYP